MNLDIKKRLEKLEEINSRAIIGCLWVKDLGGGKYLVERPDYLDAPGMVKTIPETLYGQIVDEDFLKKYAAVIIDTDGHMHGMFN